MINLYKSLQSSGPQKTSSWMQASLFVSLLVALYIPHRHLKKPHSSVVMPLETVGLGSSSGLATVSLFGGWAWRRCPSSAVLSAPANSTAKFCDFQGQPSIEQSRASFVLNNGISLIITHFDKKVNANITELSANVEIHYYPLAILYSLTFWYYTVDLRPVSTDKDLSFHKVYYAEECL